jgi:hypothetical protein
LLCLGHIVHGAAGEDFSYQNNSMAIVGRFASECRESATWGLGVSVIGVGSLQMS